LPTPTVGWLWFTLMAVNRCCHPLSLRLTASRKLGQSYRSGVSPQRRDSHDIRHPPCFLVDSKHLDLAILFTVTQLTQSPPAVWFWGK
jgi:hypothetical protein